MDSMGRFLAKLRDLIKGKVKDNDLTAEEFDEAVKQARSHVGGTIRWENARADTTNATEGNRMNKFKLMGEVSLSEDRASGRVQIFPAVGKYAHPVYGELDISQEFLKTIKSNFDAKAYQQDLPLTIDLEHQTKLSGAAGWIQDVQIEGDKGMFADIVFNERGQSLVKDNAYMYFSPEFYDEWTDPATNKKVDNLLIGGALTNRPFFKAMAPVVMGADGVFAFSELTFAAPLDDEDMPDMDDMMSKMQALMNKAKGQMPDEMMAEFTGLMGKMKKAMPKMQASEGTSPSGTAAGAASVDANPANRNGGEQMGLTEEEARQFSEMRESLKTLNEEVAAAKAKAASEETARKAAEADAKNAAERVAALETATKRRNLSEHVRANRLGYQGEVDAVVDRLMGLSEKLPQEDFDAYLAEHTEFHARMKESALLDQIGKSGGVASGIEAEFEAAVKKAMSEGNIERPAAIVKVASENAKLYNAYDKAFKQNIKRGGE